MEIFQSAHLLPDEWDQLCEGNYALKRSFLIFMEQTNPCEQRYYLFRNSENRINSLFMTFKKKKHNIAMFSKFNFYQNVTFIYVPLSIANAGIIIGEETKSEVEQTIKKIKGCKVILNLKTDIGFTHVTFGLTCPNILLDIKWNTWDAYLECLRSNYRHRYKKAIKSAQDLSFSLMENPQLFDDQLYGLYEQVFNGSRFQIEKLSKAFFQGERSKIIVAKKGDLPIAFIQLIENGSELVFGFVGIDYAYNRAYDLYMNMLLKMVEYAIVHHFERIDLGQTADEAKLKLGGYYVPLYAVVHHTHFLINSFIRITEKWIQYKPITEEFHVFKV